ncbi:BREX-1 system adenine-specific DNA-methyltransferase PglX [Halomonas alimentaria]|uniref:site-specific DNA-methyltransferase (adenine-specific) n=1 Tax=Halomonas alimentaria TaxID=147248 RepID=A0A7X4W598_9GAMM|nr:BREX-1 system adenine-specific DNA-methyltransferase PglX [Halomonas alimentaria]NAW33736.1 BREX-1 system adenine-specific DNA-methyltransferase PglX [Halomonas alimentaria]
MNTGNIKKYAPKARTRFIETMTRQAARYGITKGHVAPAEVRGDVMLISALDGQTHSFPKALRGPREALAKWVTQLGFEQAMEQAAYSWFNRLCAIRFMELKGYLDHGRRVLSHPDHEGGFQILDDCLEIDLPGLDTARVRELKLDGTQDEALYRELLLAQCHALHEAMPFLFEPLDDASELLLPDNLTKTDSLIRELVEAIPEEDWQDVEVIGWLYQFYIAEKKDQVIGKVVKSEDIPAATQLFTPNWIVQYLVQNSVGRQWLQTYPDSPLKGQMPYYIEPAEQEPEVQAQLDAITAASIDPETIKVLDPACGSGHILVEAYNVLKAIYEERGYRSRDIPKLVLENNLFGLDIDDRAAQLAGFALLMKAREDDRRIFSRGIRLNVMALQSTQHLVASTLWRDLNLTGDWHQGQSQNLFEGEQKELSSNDSTYKAIVDLIERFQDAKTFGSLIEVPNSFEAPLKSLLEVLTELADSGDTMQKTAAKLLMPVVQQAWVLAQRYEAVVANPPYMGSKYQTPVVKKYLKDAYKGYEKDLFSAFIVRNLAFAKDHGQLGFMTPFVWMFISSYEQLRKRLIEEDVITSLIQLEYSGFDGATVPICTFTLSKGHVASYTGSYIRLSDFRGAVNQGPKTLEAIQNRECGWFYETKPDDFKKIPGSPVAYWAPEHIFSAFKDGILLGDMAPVRKGMDTANNDRFLRRWHEVSTNNICFDAQSSQEADDSQKRWFPYKKGGEFRRWYGNNEFVLNWKNNGKEVKSTGRASIRSSSFFFKKSITWTATSSSYFGVRHCDHGHISDCKGSAVYPNDDNHYLVLAYLSTSLVNDTLAILNPTIETQAGNVASLPFPAKVYSNERVRGELKDLAYSAVTISRNDWDSDERSWDFVGNEIVFSAFNKSSKKISFDWKNLRDIVEYKTCELAKIEKRVNELFLDSIGSPQGTEAEPPRSAITLFNNPDYSVGDTDKNPWEILKSYKTAQLLSYSVGCMMGRYSLDEPGLILASQGETIGDYLAKIPEPSFALDKNAIIPLTDQEWFPDDATNRFRDFVRTIWGEEHLQENLDFVAESLCLHAIKSKKGEAALDTIRRYLSTQFYKDHLRTYKKRPIYWLFSSGKQRAFECLVYLHRYNESTLAEMRTDYVIPLTEKLAGYVEKLEQDKEASASAAEAKRIEKELSKLYKQQAELNTFDEKLRHHADQRISLDLDDGVKVNYGKFGDLLAEVKAVSGKDA